MLKGTNKYMVLKKKKKPKEKSGCMIHSNMTIKNFLFPFSLFVFLSVHRLKVIFKQWNIFQLVTLGETILF
jgi:hypothetical protein